MIRIRLHKGCIKCLEFAANALERGKLVIYPTDTAYGLGADIKNESAILKIYRVKRRPMNKPLTIALSDLDMIPEYAEVDEKIMRFLSKFLPGKVTFILRKRSTVPDLINPHGIGIRIPDNEIARRLVRLLGRPITATSANVSGRSPKYSVDEVIKEIRADLLLDAGKLKKTPPSTIVDLITGEPRLIREGPVPFNEIMKAFREEVS